MAFSWSSRYREILGYIYDEQPPDSSPYLAASFQVGDKSAGKPEYSLKKQKDSAAGTLTWDASHQDPRSPFFSVACVRLDVSRTEARWSVGTSAYITMPCRNEFRRIREVWVTASLGPNGPRKPQRLVQWNSLDLTLFDASGQWETLCSSCLPVAQSMQETRRAATGPRKMKRERFVRAQYARFRLLEAEEIVELQVRGQVTLCANCVYGQRTDLEADDLSGTILIFTDGPRAGPRRTKRSMRL